MPHQAMSDDEHSVILSELNEFVCQAKVISVFFRVYHFTLHAVFGHNGVEVAANYIDCAGVATRSLFGINGDTDKEFITENVC